MNGANLRSHFVHNLLVHHLRLLALILLCASLLPCLLSGCTSSEPKINSLPPIVLPEPAPATPAPADALPNAFTNAPGVSSPPETSDTGEFFNEPSEAPETVNIIIKKAALVLELYGDGELIGRFPVHIGEAEGHKQKEGDRRTPEGKYYICSRKDSTENTLFLGISYPNADDARAAYDDKRIDKSTRDAILAAIQSSDRPPWDTPLGGAIGIHGKYDSFPTTSGSIALSDENVRLLWDYASSGTVVEILP